MATVDGATVQPDNNGIIQGNGGDSDKLSGGNGNDKLEGHANFNQYFGGAGNDTFILAAKFGERTTEPSKVFDTQASYVTDFHGANGSSSSAANTGEHDFIALSGFGAGSQVTLIGEGASGTSSPAKVFYYSIFDTHTASYYNFTVNSVNGQALGAGDFQFYGSVPVSA